MPDIKTDDGCIIHVEVEGPQNAPVLMLSNSLGTNLHMWDDQAPAWSRQFRLARYDRRGHGQSSVRKGPIRWSGSAATCLRSSMPWASPKSVGADCRWAAWSDSGSAPMPPPASTNLYCPTPHPISPTKRCGRAGSRPCAKKVWSNRDRRCQYGALVHQGIPRPQSASDGADARDVLGHQI